MNALNRVLNEIAAILERAATAITIRALYRTERREARRARRRRGGGRGV
ncbi:hypothetical protein [Brevibacterium gallinarum]|uniref:Uncharacterized protein n=1 Tax=Brevibacterium gallinarum TaxID=2762220 RepID=A0ABR8WRI7_9MICO|nr:hypothetical protein [Brevibacterium gallinarum]MBD8019361.1 hypothetical protein [Brevibacterium gallinarum]